LRHDDRARGPASGSPPASETSTVTGVVVVVVVVTCCIGGDGGGAETRCESGSEAQRKKQEGAAAGESNEWPVGERGPKGRKALDGVEFIREYRAREETCYGAL